MAKFYIFYIVQKYTYIKMRQRSRNQGDRATYNRLKRNLQTALKKAQNATFEQFITPLSPDDTSLWKATKSFKRPQVSIPPIRKSDGSWAKSDTEKATAFGDHLRQVFMPHSSSHPHAIVVSASLDVPCPMSLPITPFTPRGSIDGDCEPKCT